MIELLKILVQPVAIERDPDGSIVGEKVGEAVALYDLEQLEPYVAQLRAELKQANSPSGMEATNGDAGEPATGRARGV